MLPCSKAEQPRARHHPRETHGERRLAEQGGRGGSATNATNAQMQLMEKRKSVRARAALLIACDVKSVRAAGLRGPVMVPVRRTHAILPGPTPCNARAPQTDAPSCSWILRRRGVLNPVERQREIRLSRAQHWCSAAEQRHRLLHAAAGSLASCTSSSVPGGGAQSLWRRGCVQRLSQQSSEQRRNLQLLSRLRGLLGGAMDALDCTVA